MKLFATSTSERASKSQGGNLYIETVINDENKKVIYHVSIVPLPDNDTLIIEHHGLCAEVRKKQGGGYHYDYDKAISILNQQKGKKKKGENCSIKYCTEIRAVGGMCLEHYQHDNQ